MIAIMAAATLPVHGEQPLTAGMSLAWLMEGNSRYLQGLNNPDLSPERRESLAVAQHPFAVIVGCSDSRIPPEHIFDQGLGDLFVIRLAGNVVDTLALGSVEYAIAELGVPLVVVLGHEGCGAVKASVRSLLDEAEAGGDIADLLDLIKPSAESVLQSFAGTRAELYERVADANITAVIGQLLQSEIIQQGAEEGVLSIVGAKYSLGGEVTFFGE